MFACRRHWYTVPKPLRDALLRVYRPGQEIDKQPSAAYLVIQRRLVLYLAEKEQRPIAVDLHCDLAQALRLIYPAAAHLDDRAMISAFDRALEAW